MIYKDYRPVPWWSLAIFLAALPAIGFGVVPFLPDREMMTVLGAFFVIGFLAVIVAVAPLGWAAIPALGLRPANWKYPVFGVLGTLALSIGVSQFGLEPQGMKQVIEIVREPKQLAISLLLLAVLAPLVEELVFRGLLYGWIAGRWNSLAAWLISSLVFAAAHVEPAHVILVLPLGLLFGWLRRRTDSLLPSLFAHILNNGFALLAAVYLPGL
ncbi:MAG: CPBP family intramembrane metalloprotease [Reyranella sp.]|uniref:CPBP family intramembrane glutamic endopeptidase n=1 Tax=Reyranella sp. TaxID=1929291 RepID=UPI001AD2B84A|nr:type II CAAX endopeptidase family protein [Reyranella sp.]MBN9091094.1 CPBP family intramembrane metalloprotease [Reyranella sp.]